MEQIDQFIQKHREWELETAQRIPKKLSMKRPLLDQRKPRIVLGRFSENNSIKVMLHHLACFSDEDFFHCHDFFEMIYVYRGNCLQRFPDKEFTMREHDLLLLNPYTIHAPYTMKNEDSVFNILISKTLFERSLLSLISDNRIFSEFIINCLYQSSKSNDYLYFPANENEPVLDLVESIIIEYLEKELSYQKVMEASLVLLFAKLSRIYHKRFSSEVLENQKNTQTIVSILAYINENAPNVSLESISERFNYSTGHLSRMIHQFTGKPYSQIVQKFKIERARSYLENSELTIPEIMELSGFHSANYFYRMFKKFYLMTPNEYRSNYAAANKIEKS